MEFVIAAAVVTLGVAVYFMATRPCMSRMHNHRHWRFRPHRR